MPTIFDLVQKQSDRNCGDRAFKSDDVIGCFLPIRPRIYNRTRETRMEIELRSSSFGHRSCIARTIRPQSGRIISDAVFCK